MATAFSPEPTIIRTERGWLEFFSIQFITRLLLALQLLSICCETLSRMESA